MWIGDGDLRVLEYQVQGYCTALSAHAVDERVPSLRHFSDWIRLKREWSTCGWASAIVEAAEHAGRTPLQLFFELIDEYRQLIPKQLAYVRLAPHHRPTGRHCVIGFGQLVAPPRRINVLQYAPEPLHFLRFHFDDGPEDRHMLIDNGNVATSAAFARAWVEEEFQVEPTAWRFVA